MSYSRWGEDGSSVYVYGSVFGCVTCCGCTFVSGETEPYENAVGETMTFSLDNVDLHSAAEVVAHMQQHVAAGDTVPAYLLDETLYPPTDFLKAGTPAYEAAEAAEKARLAAAAAEVMAAFQRGELTALEVQARADATHNWELGRQIYLYQQANLPGDELDDYILATFR